MEFVKKLYEELKETKIFEKMRKLLSAAGRPPRTQPAMQEEPLAFMEKRSNADTSFLVQTPENELPFSNSSGASRKLTHHQDNMAVQLFKYAIEKPDQRFLVLRRRSSVATVASTGATPDTSDGAQGFAIVAISGKATLPTGVVASTNCNGSTQWSRCHCDLRKMATPMGSAASAVCLSIAAALIVPPSLGSRLRQ
ncbi:Uncharacterized protein Fot_21560 [Forsythia ovata]|uniref:Uncharacterized protein n=1 Tax=Forsythia ovata TaxID=205694 RepID=A0ABD1UV64_9LAMI